MVYSDIALARPHIEDENFSRALEGARIAIDTVREKSGVGAEWLGWRDLLLNPNNSILDTIIELSDEIRSNADIFIVCGIGGSYLGSKAVISALSTHFKQDGPEVIYAGHHISGKYLEDLIEHISTPNKDGKPKSVYLNVISKSGTTLETALSFKKLRSWIENEYGDHASQRIICTTSEEGGILNSLIAQKGYRKFVIPDNVGGRFSVLTPVGLLPISVAGIDIDKIFSSAVASLRYYDENPDNIIEYAAARYCLQESGITVDLFASFEDELSDMGGWLQQLLGESEGKGGLGIFPSVASYSTDLHSIGQFVQEGKRSVMETFLIVDQAFSNIQVSSGGDDLDGLDYLDGMSFHEINTKARLGTIEAHTNGGVPVVRIHLNALDEKNIGELIYFFELFTAVYVYSMQINPFDQPGVEGYKKAMYRLLGKV